MSSPKAVGAIGNLERIALLFAAAAVVFQCFVPPTVGLADNGDFPKIAGQLDVGNPLFSKDVVRFADLKYVVDSKYHWNSQFYSSELLLFAAAFGLDSIRGKPETFDLRLLGAIHAAIFLLAFYRLLPLLNSLRPALRMVLLCLILLFFTDVMYVAYFNSFFMDTGALLFLLLAVVSFLRALRWQKPLDRWLFVASSMLLVTSKTQHFLLGIPIAMLLACKGGLLTRGRGWAFRTFSAIAVLAAIAFSNRFGAPAHYPTMGSYTVIFFELLPKSKDVSSDLKDLGLDDSYKQYVGTNAYSPGAPVQDPERREVLKPKVSYAHIARFFIKHPSRAVEATVLRMGNAGMQRPYAGNYDKRAGFAEYAQTRAFTVWSALKARFFGGRGARYIFYSLFVALAPAAFAIVRRKSLPSGIPEAMIALASMALIALLVASLADALDAERHYSLFSALTDLSLICGVSLSATMFTPARTPTPIHHPASEAPRPGTIEP